MGVGINSYQSALMPAELDHLGPLLGFVGDELAEVGGRAREHVPPRSARRAFILGSASACIDLPVELVDNLGGRVLGCADAYQSLAS